MRREERTVHPDFSDVQLLGRFYRVDKRLRKDRVEVRYDPFGTLDTVLIYSLRGEYLGKGVLHHREKGEDSCPEPQAKPKYNYLDLLIQEHERELRKRAQGIDYQKVLSQKGWPFSAFAKSFAQLLGRKGELSSFSTEELECLQKVYNRNPWITEMSLLEAFEKAQEKTILYIVREIQNIADRKDH
jgi:hypothetical protein